MTLDTYTALIFVAGFLAGTGVLLMVFAAHEQREIFHYLRRRRLQP